MRELWRFRTENIGIEVPIWQHAVGIPVAGPGMRTATPVCEGIGVPIKRVSASKYLSKQTGVVEAMQRAATEGSLSESSMGLSAMAIGTSSL